MSCKKAEDLLSPVTQQSGYDIQIEYKDSYGYLNDKNVGGQGHGVYMVHVNYLSGVHFIRVAGDYTNITITRDGRYVTRVGNTNYLKFK